jgi:hypothetical protein
VTLAATTDLPRAASAEQVVVGRCSAVGSRGLEGKAPGKAAAGWIGERDGGENGLAGAFEGRSGRLRASRRVPLDTITAAILAGNPNLGHSAEPSPIPKPRAEVRVLPGALSSSNRLPLPIFRATRQWLQRP